MKLSKELQLAKKLEQSGRRADALSIYQRIAVQYPGNAEAKRGVARLGGRNATTDPVAQMRALFQQRQFQALVKLSGRLPKSTFDTTVAHTLVGAAQMELGQPKRAEKAFRAAVATNPEHPASHNNLGLALRAQGQPQDAKTSFEAALTLKPGYAEAWNSLGAALQDMGNTKEAGNAFEKASHLKPKDPEIWTNLGNTYQQTGQFGEAKAAYNKALALSPEHAGAHYNLGLALKSAGQLTDAIAHYQRAILCRPGFAAAHNNLGNTLQALGKLTEAEASIRKAIALAPNDAEAHNNLGTVLQKMGRLDEAVKAYEAALKVDPNHSMAQAQRLHQMAHMCDWRAYTEFAKVANELGIEGEPVAPLTLLAIEDAPERQRIRAERYAEATFGQISPLPIGPVKLERPQKLRIGYFSADYRNHPVARLIAGMIAAHDRDRFELLAYSFGPDTKDELRDDLSAEFSAFRDIRAISDVEAARLAAEDELDIAIDLTAYTQHSRTALFARRLAPIQLNFLGYPGTSGASFMDYILVDPILIPEAERKNISEKLLMMPHCYQPNDDRRDIPVDKSSRADHGLPETGTVLSCFNSAYKITPREFSIWMRVLKKSEGSVLWLLDSNRWVRDNLEREAARQGVDPNRFIFAPRASNADHLARHRHIDLFVDTFAYNAHTTGSDALWMGVPVVTLAGRQFAARVCASLLEAVGLPELITATEQEYEELILKLVNSKSDLAALRASLETKGRLSPLFNTKHYTRALEAGLDTIEARWRRGDPPADTIIPAQ